MGDVNLYHGRSCTFTSFLLPFASSNTRITRAQLGGTPPGEHLVASRLIAETIIVFAHEFAHFLQHAPGTCALACEEVMQYHGIIHLCLVRVLREMHQS